MINQETYNTLKTRMKARFPMLLEGYLRDAKIYLETIQQNIPNNLKPIIEAAHSLKSASGLLGLMDVHEAAKTVEYQGKEQNTKPLPSSYATLEQSFSKAEPFLQAELQQLKSA